MGMLRMSPEEYEAWLKKQGKTPQHLQVKRPQPKAEKKAAKPKTEWEMVLARQLLHEHRVKYVTVVDYPFDRQVDGTGRLWRIDVAMPAVFLAIEVDGAVHRIKGRFKGDIEKHQALILAGWTQFRVTPQQVESGEAATMVMQLLERMTP